MAEIQEDNFFNKRRKNKQKKQTLRVDFTPMVDMNMLLITFFMFCTTFLKPQTMNINMPSKDKVEKGKENKVKESGAITVVLAENNKIYYYLGIPKPDGSSYKEPDFLIQTSYDTNGIRQLLLKKNSVTYAKIQTLKLDLQNQLISKEEFKQKSQEIQERALKVEKTAPTVIIKPSELANYENLVNILDEMLICNIGTYAVVDLTDGDRFLLYKKTSNPAYLTEEQRLQGI